LDFTRKPGLTFILLGVLLSTFVNLSYSWNLQIEFVFQDPRSHPDFCEYCYGHQISLKEFLDRCTIVEKIEEEYAGQVVVEWVPYDSPRGQELARAFNIRMIGLYAYATIIIDNSIKIEEKNDFTEENLKQIIDAYLTSIHDVSVLGVIVDPRCACIGDVIEVCIIVKNKGKQPEFFNVTVLYDDFIIETLFVEVLEPNSEKVLTLHWRTEEVGAGNYSLIVYAHPVPGEKNIDDNLYQAGTVEIRYPDAPMPVRRDVVIETVVPSKWRISNQEELNITVAVRNAGTITENFNVKISLNSTIIKEWPIANLNPNDSLWKVFNLETKDLPPGDYIIKVQAEPVEDEVNLVDNERILTITVMAPSKSKGVADLVTAVSLAFFFGFFETFSPCTIILLAFILSYTMGDNPQFKKRFLQVMAFAAGFLTATALVFSAIALGLLALSLMLGIQHILMLSVSVLAIFFGLNLLGFNVFKIFKIKADTKPLMQKLTKKHAYTFTGLFTLGFLFYFLDPCLAPVFVPMIGTFSPTVLFECLPLILFIFCLGAIVPFVGIGILSYSISKLARISYKHKSKIKGVSGLILIGYAVFLITRYILRYI